MASISVLTLVTTPLMSSPAALQFIMAATIAYGFVMVAAGAKFVGPLGISLVWACYHLISPLLLILYTLLPFRHEVRHDRVSFWDPSVSTITCLMLSLHLKEVLEGSFFLLRTCRHRHNSAAHCSSCLAQVFFNGGRWLFTIICQIAFVASFGSFILAIVLAYKTKRLCAFSSSCGNDSCYWMSPSHTFSYMRGRHVPGTC